MAEEYYDGGSDDDDYDHSHSRPKRKAALAKKAAKKPRYSYSDEEDEERDEGDEESDEEYEEGDEEEEESDEEDEGDDKAAASDAKKARIEGIRSRLYAGQEVEGSIKEKQETLKTRIVQDNVDRLTSARDRHNRRHPDGPRGYGDLATPYGTVKLKEGHGDGGYVTTNAKNFKGTTTNDGTYEDLLARATPKTLQLAIAHSKRRTSSERDKEKYFEHYFPGEDDPGADLDPEQKRILATLIGIDHSEEQRHRSGPKSLRAGLRAALAAGSPEERADALYQHFPQGVPGDVGKSGTAPFATGAQAYHAPDGETNSIPALRQKNAQSIAGGYLSEDSDDDGPVGGAGAAAKDDDDDD